MRLSWLRLFWLTVVLAGAVAGYLVSSGLGTRLLHDEIETQLSRLLDGPVTMDSVAVHWDGGLQIEAREVSAFPTVQDSRAGSSGPPDTDRLSLPVVRARRVLAWVDLVSLLIGRLEIATLVLEGPHIRLVENPDGSLAGLPLPPPRTYPDEGLEDRTDAELFFARIASIDESADAFAEDFRAADRIEVVDGTLEWIGRNEGGEPSTPLRVELLNGSAERQWLSDAIAVQFGGVFIDGVRAPFSFEIGVHRAEDRHFAWSLALPRIPLDLSQPPFSSLEGLSKLSGDLDIRFRLYTHEDGRHRLSFEGRVDKASVALIRSGTVLDREEMKVGAALVIDPVAIRLEDAHITGPNLTFQFQGQIDRPIRPRSSVRIKTRTEGVDLERIREYAASVEGESDTAFTVARLTERVRSGRVRYIEMAGTTSLSRWQGLLSGHMREIPAGFVFGGAFDGVSLETSPDAPIEQLEGQVEWIEDRIAFRHGRGIYRGRPLPELNVVLDGISHLVRARPEDRLIKNPPPALPGIGPFLEILRPRDPDALPPLKAVGLALDHLEHPLFRWPFRQLRVLIEPLRRGVEVTVRDGLWGGARVKGEVVWFDDPSKPSVSATLTLSEPFEPGDQEAGSETVSLAAETDQPEIPALTSTPSDQAPDRNSWGQGRFEIQFRPRRFLPFQKATGFVRLEQTKVFLDDLDIRVKVQGTMAARLGLDFDSAESVGFDTSFALQEGRLQEIGPFVALPPDLAEGSIDASGSLAGRVRPRTSFIADLEGRVRAEARAGTVKTTLPLMFRLAKATEGYNPFAKENQLSFETMQGTFAIQKGMLSVEDFEIEGPLRVYAKADIDTVSRPASINAVVGIFLFRRSSAMLENLPIIRSFLPGSERGLVGTYFRVEGPLGEPEIDTLPLATLMTSVPDIIKAPFKVLGSLFDRDDGDDGDDD